MGLYWKTINELVKGPQAQHSLSSSSSAVIQALGTAIPSSTTALVNISLRHQQRFSLDFPVFTNKLFLILEKITGTQDLLGKGTRT